MTSVASFSGVASGIQWRDMIDQLLKLESRPMERLQERISALQSRSAAWDAFRARVQALDDAAKALADGSSFGKFTTATSGVPGGAASPFSLSVGTDATPGTYQVRVLSLAASEKLGGASFASRTDALGLGGEFLINGVRVQVEAGDSLTRIAERINAANSGAARSGVAASVVAAAGGGFRLTLTSEKPGASGIDLVEGPGGALRALGFLDGSTAVKTATSSGAKSDGFGDRATAVATLRGFAAAPAGTVTLGSGASQFSVALDLGAMSLDDLAAAINSAAGASPVRASVVAETVDGKAVQRLEIGGTNQFVDAGGVLEALGILRGGRADVAQQLRGAVQLRTAADAVAEAGTRFLDLNAGVQAGETLTIAGTRGDGSAVSLTFTIGTDTTLGDLVDALNGADAFGKAGARAATARIEDGRLVLEDGTAGESRLALSIISNNEQGGSLDFGAIGGERAGLSRRITAGADAEVEIDGMYFRRASNAIADAVPGLSLNLTAAAPDTPVRVTVSRDVEAAVAAIDSFVKAYNTLAEFVDSQASSAGGASKPLAGDAVLRSMRTQLRGGLETRLGAAAYARLADIGIEVDRYGRYQVDSARLRSAVETGAPDVARLFGVHGATGTGGLEYVSAGDSVETGSYAVVIAQVAARAAAAGSSVFVAFDDDRTPPVLSVRDLGTGRTYSIAIERGMDLSAVVARLNNEFGTATRRRLAGDATLYAGAGAADPVTEATKWADVYKDASTPAGFQDGTVLTFSGTRSNGQSFVGTHTVGSAAGDSVGGLLTAVRLAIGEDAEVTIENGRIVATSRDSGSSQLALAITADLGGGPVSPFGQLAVEEEGRGRARIVASDVGGRLQLQHDDYGASAGFEILASDGQALLGLAAGEHRGTDVQGSIGGVAATGSGRFLTGAAGSPAEGLVVSYTGAALGTIGEVSFGRGVAAVVSRATKLLLGTGDGSIAAQTDRAGLGISGLQDRIDRMEGRLERRREELVRRFTRMEMAMSRAQGQSAWLSNQIASMLGTGS